MGTDAARILERLFRKWYDQQAAKFIDLACKVYGLGLQDFHRMAAIAVIF